MIGQSRFLTILLFCLGFLPGLHAQYYSSGQDPASVKWQQINTPHFRIIYPKDYLHTAQYVANIMEYAATIDTITLSSYPKKISVILHNKTAVSNAQSLWAPRRMDFYTIPPQDTYPQEWFQQLGIHEFRHTIQLTKLNQGLTKVLTYIFGEQATAAVLGLYLPLWFIEGDAVAAETELSKTGRGRSPAFAMPLRAQFLDKEIYSYDKAVLGSYKNFIPDRYILGYHIVAKGRNAYGPKIWNHTVDKVAKQPYMVVPFSEGIRDISGKNKTTFYRDMMTELKSGWKQQSGEVPFFSHLEILSPDKDIFTQYIRPYQTESGTIIAEKRALDDIPRFVEIDKNGNEKVIHTPGFYFSGSLTYANNLIAWTEYAYDPRWENRNWAVVKIMNLQTGKIRVLKNKTRYFAPALSPDGSKIAAVEVTESQEYRIVVMDTSTGKVLFKYHSPGNDFFTYPSFDPEGERIVTTAVGDSGNRLIMTELQTGNANDLTEPTFTEISQPVFWGKRIVFIGAYSGINNLYVLDISSGAISQLTSLKFGVSDPFVTKDGRFIFSDYTADGYRIALLQDRDEHLRPLGKVPDNSVKLYEALAAQADTILEPSAIPDTNYATKKYSRLGHLLNFHSWAPMSIDVDNYNVKPGISVLSQNVLSTAFAGIGWEYDLNEETGKYYVDFTYERWYPALDFRADYGRRNSYTLDTAGNRIDYSWMETNFSTNARVPLNFTTNKYSRFIQPSVKFEYLQLDMDEDAEVSFRRSNYKAISYRLNASNLLKRNFRDINPKWGQVLDLNYRTAPFNRDTLGSMLAAETRLFFPGLLRHHSFNMYGGYQKRYDDNPLFGTIVRYPRGHSRLYTTELTSLSASYAFPIAYPDLSLSSLAYIKRIRANLFYDYARGMHFGSQLSWQSLGAELYLDLHILRFLAPMQLGYRFIYRPDENDIKSEFLFSVSFDGF